MAAPDAARNNAAPEAVKAGAEPQDDEIKVVKLAPGDIPLAVGSDDEVEAEADDPFAVEEEDQPEEEADAVAAALKAAAEEDGETEEAEEPEAGDKKAIGDFLDDIFADAEETENNLSAFTDLEPLSMIEVASELEAVLEELKLRQDGQ